jgi:N-methylhydantoinase A
VAQIMAGVDIGGTFTDVVLIGNDGRFQTKKLLSTPSDYCKAILEGLVDAACRIGEDQSAIAGVVHATTIATNIILEKRGARVALVTTQGFRDVLEMRRLRIPRLYDLQYIKPDPLIPRHLRFEIAERMGPDGSVWRQLDEVALALLAREIEMHNVDAVAVALLHAYANPRHEIRVAEMLRRHLPKDVFITCSSDVLPEIREYERTSTTAVNAYVGPTVSQYLSTLVSRLGSIGIQEAVHVMESGGGVMPVAQAIRRPAQIVESGPAAGVIACARLAMRIGQPNVISFDMGGTTAKAAMIEGGEPAKTTEFEVGGGISLSSRLVKGGGYAIKLPFIDVSEIGAGGGSIVTVDPAGTLKVGPESAGAAPGPVCYGLGGVRATLTDCLMVLGYLNPSELAGGSVPVDVASAREAISRDVAEPLSLQLDRAAYGVFEIAIANMTRAVKAVSTYRGRDPRDFALVAFGGNGPVVAASIARALDLPRVIVPPSPGVFSAVGLLFARIEREFTETMFRRACDLVPVEIAAAQERLIARGVEAFERDGHRRSALEIRRSCDFRYSGQAYELTVPLEEGIAAGVESFHAEHERTFGYRGDSENVDVVNLRVMISVVGSEVGPQAVSHLADVPAPEKQIIWRRNAYFGPSFGVCQTPVFSGRSMIGPDWRNGPLIIEEYDATCVIPPDAKVRLDGMNNIEISFK